MYAIGRFLTFAIPNLSQVHRTDIGPTRRSGGRRNPPLRPRHRFGYRYMPSRRLMPCSSQALSAQSICDQPWQLP